MCKCSEDEKVDENKDEDIPDNLVKTIQSPHNESSSNENEKTPGKDEIKKEIVLNVEVLHKRQEILQKIRTSEAFKKVFFFL
jgi:hypothetical protein